MNRKPIGFNNEIKNLDDLYVREKGVIRNRQDAKLGLSYHRGVQQGIYDAYKTIEKTFPKAAKYLLNSYGMDKRGVIVI